MAITKLPIAEFLKLAIHNQVLDVRSPGEFNHAHIPGACSLPLFSDEERKIVGTAYKQQNKETAIKLGLDFFGVKMRKMVEEAESIFSGSLQENNAKKEKVENENGEKKTVLVHCWRGGMRSAGVAWLLDLYGFNVYTLVGGYKAYRNWVLNQFEKDYDFKMLGGYTGSGKTILLHQLEKEGQQIIDLEKLAGHKGSAFGGIGLPEQPSQEMFENQLATALNSKKNEPIWLEDESQRIGVRHLPHSFWNIIRTKPVYFIDVPFHERLKYIVEEYGACDKAQLHISIERIQKRLGPVETKNALAFLQNNQMLECFGILLLYYDKHYKKGLQNRENIDALLNKIPCLTVDSMTNTEKLLACNTAIL